MSPTSHGAQARLWLIFLEKEGMTRDLKASPPAWGRSSWAERRKGVVGDGDGGGGPRCGRGGRGGDVLSWTGGQGEGGSPLRGPSRLR